MRHPFVRFVPGELLLLHTDFSIPRPLSTTTVITAVLIKVVSAHSDGMFRKVFHMLPSRFAL